MIPGAVLIALATHLQTFPGSDAGVVGSGEDVVGGGRHSAASFDYWWVAGSVVPGQF